MGKENSRLIAPGHVVSDCWDGHLSVERETCAVIVIRTAQVSKERSSHFAQERMLNIPAEKEKWKPMFLNLKQFLWEYLLLIALRNGVNSKTSVFRCLFSLLSRPRPFEFRYSSRRTVAVKQKAFLFFVDVSITRFKRHVSTFIFRTAPLHY